jgi:hypothetical protein
MANTFDRIAAAGQDLKGAKKSHADGLKAQKLGMDSKVHFAMRDVYMKNARTYLSMRKDGYRGSLPPLATDAKAAGVAAAKGAAGFASRLARHIPVVAGALGVATLASTAKAFAQVAGGGPTGESGIQPTHANAAGTVAHRTEMRQIQVQRGGKTFMQGHKVRVD